MFETSTSPSDIIGALDRIYQDSVSALTSALQAYLRHGQTPDPSERAEGIFCYPELVIMYNPDGPPPPISRAFGKISEPGTYTTTVTQPEFFRRYLLEQLQPLLEDYDITVEVRRSAQEIPYAYVWEQGHADGLDEINPAELARWFPSPRLGDIGDEIADGEDIQGHETRPLALFDGLRTDFSLKRLEHYTGTRVADFQRYVLFTNYHRYVDAFCDWGLRRISEKGRYRRLAVSGGPTLDTDDSEARGIINDASGRRYQMPAYHLTAEGGSGITLVNIGVGPSNAKTITDHLAVLRPECWIMVGHCGGLRHSQAIGDYVLGHAYLRDDHVLDAVLPPDIPVPPIAEVQVALQEAAAEVTGESGDDLKRRLRTGTIATTDDRNWELRITDSTRRFNQSRAIAIDMESATIAANGFRLRVPYGVLLCVSDKPLHGELKLPGAANKFYERSISQHLKIGVATLEKLAHEGVALHSRKLRAFAEPPFR
ncbi:MAG: AMP nucleosidase [Henriciella sp.]